MVDVIPKQSVIDQINALTLDGEFSQSDVNYLINYLIANGANTGSPRDLIQIRRGNKADLPTLAQGELAVTLDTKDLYIGGAYGNILVNDNTYANPIDFGAKTTDDDTEAFKSCIAFAKAAGLKIRVPDGTYVINDRLNITVPFEGASMRGVLFDFSNNPDPICLRFNDFKSVGAKFRVKGNPNVQNQYLMDIFYCSDASTFSDITFEDNAPNGIRVSKLWYANFRNIRMRSILNTGHGIEIRNHVEGGVNGIHFDNIYIQGGKHCLLFTGSEYISETLDFTSCTFENCYKTAIKAETSFFRNIKFTSCYFESLYKDVVDVDAPILLDNSNTSLTGAFIFDNCNVRSTRINNRVLIKGAAKLKDVISANSFEINNDGSPFIVQNVVNVQGIGSPYHSGLLGGSIIERVSVADARMMFKKIMGVKTVPLSTATPLFTVKAATSNTVSMIKVKFICQSSVNTYVSTIAEYNIICNARGSVQESKVQLVSKLESNSDLFDVHFTLSASASAYNAATDTHDFTVSAYASHQNFVGTYTLEVEGFNTSTNGTNNNKRIVFV